jgi:PPM family protein phosphatase
MALADQIQFFAATDTGRKRAHNEDNFLVDRELGLYVVADGMGGHAAGEIASAIAVRAVHEVLSAQREMLQDRATRGPQSEISSKQLLSLLDYAIQTASQRIYGEARTDARKRGMGTTVSMLLIVNSHGYVAHVGDSRIYLVRDGQPQQVTEDHTVANELLRLGMVTRDQLDKVPRKNAITRAVGVYQHAEVDTLTLEVLPKDQFLLASDGLCGYFDDTGEDIGRFLAPGDGDQVVKGLIDFANDHGGKDNITAVLVRLGGGDNSDSLRARRLQLKREMLAAMPLFSRLSERELLRVMQVADVYEYEPGEVVVHEGEHGERMFVTLQGKLSVSTNNQTVAEIGPGEHFGEMALIRSRPRSATIRALVRSEVITLKRGDFFEIIRTEPHIAVKLLWQFLGVIANRLEIANRDVSKARAGERPPDRPWVDDEPSLDPFAQPVGLSRLSFHPPLQRDLEALAGLADASFDDAPALAQRLDDTPSLSAPSLDAAPALAARRAPSFENAPAMAERLDVDMDRALADQALAETPRRHDLADAPPAPSSPEPFDARSTLPRESMARESMARESVAREGSKRTTQVMDQIDEEELLAKRKTLPGPGARLAPRRERHSTLKSHESRRDPLTGIQQPSPPSVPYARPPISRPGTATVPDGMLRRAREEGVSEHTTHPEGPLRGPPSEPSGVHADAAAAGMGGVDRSRMPTVRSGVVATSADSHPELAVPSEDSYPRPADALAVPVPPTAGEPAAEGDAPDSLSLDDDEALDRKKTVAFAGRGKEGFRPTKRTIPLEPPDALRSELDALRKEFKERLKLSRKARKQQDSD